VGGALLDDIGGTEGDGRGDSGQDSDQLVHGSYPFPASSAGEQGVSYRAIVGG
jgi:hypothetical protein